MNVVITVEPRGLDLAPIVECLENEGHSCKLHPMTDSGEEELLDAVSGAHAVIAGLEIWNENVLRQVAGTLKIIARFGIGCDSVDLCAAAKLGIAVTNTPGAMSQAVAELALTQFLCLSRSICQFNNDLHNGCWGKPQIGNNVAEKTVGIVGFGDIGRCFAKLLTPFKCDILACDPNFNYDFANRINVREKSLDEILALSDCVSLHLPVTPETENLVNWDFLSNMKRGSFLLNTSRGKIVDETALCRALREGHLGGAALDVFREEPLPEDHALRRVPNLLLTPHIGSATAECFLDAGILAAREVCDCLSNKKPRYLVNQPIRTWASA